MYIINFFFLFSCYCCPGGLYKGDRPSTTGSMSGGHGGSGSSSQHSQNGGNHNNSGNGGNRPLTAHENLARDTAREDRIARVADAWMQNPTPARSSGGSSGSGGSGGNSSNNSANSAPRENLLHFSEVFQDTNELIIYGCAFDSLSYDSRHENKETFGQLVKTVEKLAFMYVDFDDTVDHLNKLKKFSRLSSVTFRHNRLHSLKQIDTLSILNIEHLTVTDNPICSSHIFRMYACFRLPSLTKINDVVITEAETQAAQRAFTTLRDHWVNPAISSTLQTQIPAVDNEPADNSSSSNSRTRPNTASRRGNNSSNNNNFKSTSVRENSQKAINLAGGMYVPRGPVSTKTPNSKARRMARKYVDDLLAEVVVLDNKLKTFHNSWEQIVDGLIQNALDEIDREQGREEDC